MVRFRKFHILCCIGYTLLCLVWRAVAGQEFNWDHVHYHLYVAHAWWNNRLPEELFAAGPQSYLNPLPHLPFYTFYQLGMDKLAISLSVAFFHSINLWLLHFIACRLIPPVDRMRRLAIVCSVLLAALSPAFQYEVGTSHTDVIVSMPALGALLLLLVWQEHVLTKSTDWRPLYAAGLLAGVAIGFKLSSLVFCAALMIALIVLSGRQAWGVAWRALLSGTAGFALSGGPHAWMLWRSFGNPVFPLFNGIFRSPWFPQVNVVSERFRPASLEAALRFPLDMADSFKRVSFEGLVVDIRPIWLLGLVVCVILVSAIRYLRSVQCVVAPVCNEKKLFWFSLVIFMPAWIYSSGNIRYAVPSLLLLGPAIGLLVLSFVGRWHILALLALLLPLTAQAVLAITLNTLQMTKFDWKGSWRSRWFDVAVPAPLNRAPAYYLTLQAQSFASLATIFPPGSRFLNLIGSTSLPADSMVLDAMEAYRQAKGLPLRTLYEVRTGLDEHGNLEKYLDRQNSLLSEYGYKIKGGDCLFVGWNQGVNLVHQVGSRTTNEQQHGIGSRNGMVSCVVDKADALSPIERARRKRTDARIDRWARKCPEVFFPLGFSSVQYPHERRRHFPATDMQIVELDTAQLVATYWGTSQASIYLENADGVPLVNGCPPRPSS